MIVDSTSDGCSGYDKSVDCFGVKVRRARKQLVSDGPDFMYTNTGEMNRFHRDFDSQTDGVVHSQASEFRWSNNLIYFANSSPVNGPHSCYSDYGDLDYKELNSGWAAMVRNE